MPFLSLDTVPAAKAVRLQDMNSGLDGWLVIHSTALGPAAGGCRFWTYDNLEEVAEDAFRLAEGMSYKNAMAGLPFGGGKAVLRRPGQPFDRQALFRAFGRAVEALNGEYVTAEDVGTSVADMEAVASATRHVAGLESSAGLAGGDPSPWTAKGVFDAMEAAARLTMAASLSDLTVAIQGTGNVGGHLCRLLAEAGASLIVADIDPERRSQIARQVGAKEVDVSEIASVDADVFSPCALGKALTDESVSNLKASLVCGAANNQLGSARAGELLVQRNIAYVPDYVANAGGIISVSAEYLGEDEASVSARVSEIGPRVAALLATALETNESPAVVADRQARRLIATSVIAAF